MGDGRFRRQQPVVRRRDRRVAGFEGGRVDHACVMLPPGAFSNNSQPAAWLSRLHKAHDDRAQVPRRPVVRRGLDNQLVGPCSELAGVETGSPARVLAVRKSRIC